jgi:hypothetical protein
MCTSSLFLFENDVTLQCQVKILNTKLVLFHLFTVQDKQFDFFWMLKDNHKFGKLPTKTQSFDKLSTVLFAKVYFAWLS